MDEQYTQKIEELLQTGESQFNEKDFAKSIASFWELYQLANNAKDWVNVSFAAAWLGCVYREQGDFASAQSYFQQRLNWAQTLDDFKAKWEVLNWMAKVAEREGKVADAIHYYQAQLILVPLYGIEKNFEVEIADRIGYLYFSVQNYALAIDYLHRSAMLAKELSWDKWRANNYSTLADSYRALGSLGKAADFYGEAATLYIDLEEMEESALKCWESLKQVCRQMGDVAGAIAAEEKKLEVLRRRGDRDGEFFSVYALGTLFWESREYARAREFFDLGLTIAQELGEVATDEGQRLAWTNRRGDAEYMLGMVEEAMGRVEEALGCYGRAIELYEEGGKEEWVGFSRQRRESLSARVLGSQRQDYLKFLTYVLRAVSDSKANPQVVYPLLAANLDKLDDNFITVLPTYIEGTLSKLESSSQAEFVTTVIADFIDLIEKFPLGSKAINMEIAIAGYEAVKTILTRESDPRNWAAIQNNLGNAYRERIKGNMAENLEKAIELHQQTLEIFNKKDFPTQWAATQNNLGLAYGDRILGDKAENTEKAIASYQFALEVYTKNDFPDKWATTQNNLGNAYGDKILDDKAENLEKAIEFYQLALGVYTKNDFPIQWATTQYNLGNTYADRILGEKTENMKLAIAAYEKALSVYTPETFPTKWAATQYNLGKIYNDRISAENIEQSIVAYQLALTVYTREEFPAQWANTQNNLGTAYLYRKLGNIAENLEKAMSMFRLTLSVYSKKDFPIDWARTQHNLGIAYSSRIHGDEAENLEKAIAAYEQALLVRTKEKLPTDWAMTQGSLGNAYSNRVHSDKAENWEKAVALLQLALEVYTKKDFPYDWARTQNNLGLAYSKRQIVREDKPENFEKAIVAYQQALSVYTHQAFPYEWARTQNNLGNAYLNRRLGNRAENQELAIAAFQQALQVCTKEAFPSDWAATQNNLGIAYLEGIQAENWEKAIAAFQQALQVRTKEGFPTDWAATQNNLGNAYWGRIQGDRKENLKRALAAFQQALQVHTLEANPINHLQTSRNIGDLHFTQGDWQRAIQTYETALQAVELMRQSAITEGRRQEIIENAIEVYQNLTQAYINTRNYPKAIQTAERSKARNLLELMANRDLYPKGNVPPEILKELDRLRRLLENQTRELQSPKAENNGTSPSQPDANPDSTGQTLTAPQQQQQQIQQARERLGQEIADTRRQLDALIEKEITPIDGNFSLTQKVETIPFEQIQELTADGQTALIEWYVTAEKILAFILLPPLPQTDSSLLVREFGGEDLDKLFDFANKYVKSYYADEQHQQWREELENNLQELANILHLDELVADIQQNFAASNQTCQKLILIPHRFLHLFPIHALPVKQRQSPEALTKNLLDLFPGGVGYAPSCQLLHRVRAKQPAFDNLFAVQTPTPDLYEKYEADLGAVSAVQKQFGQSEILSKAAATKTALLKPDSRLPEANCLFFFCHGTFNPNSPVDSGLQLADATLTLGDIIAELDLRNCRLVTLSACETGLTEFSKTSDEYIGLPSGFMLAGSPNILGSLWTVNATATALLTTRFYQEVESCGNIVLALKLAQTWLRDSTIEDFQAWLPHSPLDEEWQEVLGGNLDEWEEEEGATSKPYASPYYWGAFCAIGKGV